METRILFFDLSLHSTEKETVSFAFGVMIPICPCRFSFAPSRKISLWLFQITIYKSYLKDLEGRMLIQLITQGRQFRLTDIHGKVVRGILA